MWSRSIEILNPYEAIRDSLEQEAWKKAIPTLHKTTWLSRLLRKIVTWI